MGGVADASSPAGGYHSSEGSCEFMALPVHTYISANAPVSGNRWDTQTLTPGIHVCGEHAHAHAHAHAHTHTQTHTHTHTNRAKLSRSGCLNKPVKGPLMSPIEVLNRKSLC